MPSTKTPAKTPAKRPVGRPPVKRPVVKPVDEPDVRADEPKADRKPVGQFSPGPFAICRTCFPDGWPAGATGLGCEHGIWSRPWTGR